MPSGQVSIHAAPWYYELRTCRMLLTRTLDDVTLPVNHRAKIEKVLSIINVFVRRIENVSYAVSPAGIPDSSPEAEEDLGEELQ